MSSQSKECLIGNESSYENMPDLLFVRFCEEKFGVNRGIYNTIDLWFFDHGIRQIVERRNMILVFLNSLKIKEDQYAKVKFGSKGLTEKLKEFLRNQLISEGIEQSNVI